MATALPPVKGATFSFPITLVSQADTDIFKTTVTITVADVWVSKDGGAFAAVTAAPTELETGAAAKTGVLWQGLTATEMTADIVTVLYHDAAGDEWQDAVVTIYTAAQTLDAIKVDTAAILVDTGTTLDDKLDALLTYSAGAGSITFTYTLTDSGDGTAIPDAAVEVFSDSGLSTLVATGITNASGVVVFYLNAGTYYIQSRKAGYTFVTDTEVVA